MDLIRKLTFESNIQGGPKVTGKGHPIITDDKLLMTER